MKADGSIIIDTKIVDGGMEKGFELIKDEISSVGLTAKRVGEQIELSFSKMDVSKPIANAVAKVQQLERQLAAVTSDYKLSVSEGDDKSAERLAAKRIAVYERLEAAREKLSIELASAVQKEANEEEKATQRKIKAAEKEAAAKRKATEKQFSDLTKPARKFNSRLREILSGALVFNLISSGLRSMTTYFGNALKSNTEFSKSFSQLKGSLLTAFQPIYEFVAPAIIYLVRLMTAAAQAVGRFFATLSGKSYGDMQKNAKALYDQANALDGVGSSAKEAKKQLMGFDEINRLESTEQSGGGGGGGESFPSFEEIEIPSEWEKAIESLALRIKDIFFKWEDLNAEIVSEKLITALGIIAGGLIGFAIGGPGGALIGMTIGAGLGVAISSVIFNGDGKLSGEELISALTTALFSIGGGLIGFAAGGPVGAAVGMIIGAGLGVKLSQIMFDGDGKLSSGEIIKALLAGISALAGGIIGFALGGPGGAILGAMVGLGLGFSIQAIDFEGVGNAIKEMLASVRDYFTTTFSDGFIHGLAIMVEDGISILGNLFVDFVNSVIENWSGLLSFFSNFSLVAGETIVSPSAYSSPSVAAYSVAPDIPMLAKGAVIPPNKEFMAVLGDQTHGNNLEAPEDLIRKIVREESGGYDDRVAQLLETLISVVEGIEVGDETIGRAAARYNRSASRSRGY